MKPVAFDMTPLAKALEMPRSLPTPEQPPVVEKPLAPSIDRLVDYPGHLDTNRGWLSTLAEEQIHALATHVLARHTEQGLRTVALTSALAGEGKTTLTLALAEKLASADKRVLIIDLDTHRSTLSRSAQLHERQGAMESAPGQNSDADGSFNVYPTSCRGVSIMPTGRINLATGIPLLSPARISDLCSRAFENHDIVLLDCPPLMPVADTHVIGDVADTAILVVKAGATPRDVLDKALADFGKEKFFAAVLNRARPSAIPYFHEVYGYYRRDSE